MVNANILALEADSLAGQSVNIACGDRFSVNFLLDLLEEGSGKKVERVYVDPRLGDVRDSNADISLAKELLGYEPEVTFTDGIKRTYQTYGSKVS